MNRLLQRIIWIGLVLSLGSFTWGLSFAQAAPARERVAKPTRFAFDDDRGSSVALEHAKVWVGDGSVFEDATIEIRGSRIVAVRSSADRGRLRPGTKRIDLKGQLVTPGFIAADTTLGLTEIGLEASTNDSNPETDDPIRASYDASTAIHANSSLLAVQAIEGITTAAVSPQGGLVSGQVAWIDLLTGDHQTIVARPQIALAASVGQSVQGSRIASLASLAEVFDDAVFYRSRKGAYDRRQTRNLAAHRLDLAAIDPVISGTIPLVVRAHRVSDMLALVNFAKRLRLRLVLVGASQAATIAPALARENVAVLVQPSENLPGGFDRLGARFDTAARLHEAGVLVGIAVLGEAHNVRNVTQEAGIAVAHGLAPQAALAAISLNIAKAYGMDGDYGSIQAGKVANLAIWDADPFELANVPRAVYIRGRPIPMVSRQTRLRDRYRDLTRHR